VRGESPDTAWASFERGHSLRGWMVKGDSLIIVLSTGDTGLTMDFRIIGDSLLGTAEVLIDVDGVEYPSAPARGVLVGCPRR